MNILGLAQKTTLKGRRKSYAVPRWKNLVGSARPGGVPTADSPLLDAGRLRQCSQELLQSAGTTQLAPGAHSPWMVISTRKSRKPDELIVYGGAGKPRATGSIRRSCAPLQQLENDETLLIQSASRSESFARTNTRQGLIANSNLVGAWANWDHFHELERKGLMYGQMTAGS